MFRGLARRKMRMMTVVATAALALGGAASLPTVHASSGGAVPDDGQVTPQFSTAAGAAGFRTTNTIPYWSSSFTYNGQTYPYTMVGTSPSTNASTTIPTVLIPVRFVFSPDSNLGGGNFSDVRDPYTIDPRTGLSTIQETLDSPLFQNATYPDGVGTTQFGDAIQRATFDKTGSNGYHVLLGAPTILPEQTFNVPAKQADVHSISARINVFWFDNVIQQMIKSLHIDPKTLPIFATYNTLLYLNRNPADCCVVGYHGAPTPQCRVTCTTNGNGAQPLHTFVYEAWTSPGIFRNPSFQDILAFSHEVSEWLNDPFVDNNVPPWVALGPAPFCQGNLETGDVLEELSGAAFPVTINGFTYHPQTEALLPWFERQSPSTAVAGAYSYPNTTLAPTFAANC